MAIAEGKWKPVELDGALFNTALTEGLIGIEECTDYDAESIVTVPKKKRKQKTVLKSDLKKVKLEKPLYPSTQGSTIDEEKSEDSMTVWNEFALAAPLLKALQEQKFYQPTEIQLMTLPSAILGQRDILGAAETGSGKTLAFGLPILNGILKLKESDSVSTSESGSDDDDDEEFIQADENGVGCIKAFKIKDVVKRKPFYALILCPTRELAMQVANHLTTIAKYTDIGVAVIVGGMAAVKQERILSKGPEIVVGTPGRLWELIQQGNDHLSQIDNIKFLAIDETDRMLEKGHFQELHELLERLNMDEKNKQARQNFVFSATLTLIHDIPKHLLNRNKIKGRKLANMTPEQKLQKIVDTLGVNNPKIVDLSQGKGTSGTLTECRITCAIDEKDYYVYYFLKKHTGRTLIFCNSIGCVKRLTTLLSLLECDPLPLHASMQQRQRLKNLERFRDKENSILIATDVAARGLDIPKIDHVLHYQTPRTSESYVHRSGRTARASKEGITVLIMEPTEFCSYIKLCRTLNKNEDLPLFPVEDRLLAAVKERVNLARDLDKVQLQVKKANAEEGWLQKAAREMDIIVDDRSKKYDSKETGRNKKVADLKRKQLSAHLATPIFPKGYSGKFPLMDVLVQSTATSAVETMKTSMANYKSKKHIPLYKPKKEQRNTETRNVLIKLPKQKNMKRKSKNK